MWGQASEEGERELLLLGKAENSANLLFKMALSPTGQCVRALGRAGPLGHRNCSSHTKVLCHQNLTSSSSADFIIYLQFHNKVKDHRFLFSGIFNHLFWSLKGACLFPYLCSPLRTPTPQHTTPHPQPLPRPPAPFSFPRAICKSVMLLMSELINGNVSIVL